MTPTPKRHPMTDPTNIDLAAEIIRLAMLSPTFRSPEIRALTTARALHTAGLLMPDGMSTQTETAGPWEAADATD